MNRAIQQEITNQIRNGSYFREAREWYARKYILPIAERSFLTVLAVLAVSVFIYVASNVYRVLPIAKEVPFVIKASHSEDYFTAMHSLARGAETPQESVARYVLEDYLVGREHYDYKDMQGDKLKYHLKKMKNSSTPDVYRDYRRSISQTNPQSPLVRYRNGVERVIRVNSVRLEENDRAVIHYTATEIDYKNKTRKNSAWEAEVIFRIPDVESIAHIGAPFRFVISSYRTRLISS